MEVGPVATEFEQEDISTTLAKCQRYYQKWLSDTTFDAFADCGMSSDTRAFWNWRISPTMRAEPTMLAVGTYEIQIQENNRDVTANPLINRATPDTIQMFADIGADNNEAGKIGFIRNKNDADAYIEFKAEL